MTTLTKSVYKITALTNLHVGSGDNNYGIVDKLVQRDPVNGFPIIHASSLKGAIRNYAKEVLEYEEDGALRIIFGSAEYGIGTDKFFSAHLLSMPVRSNKKPWFRGTCPFLINEITTLLQGFGIDTSSWDNKITNCFKDVPKEKKYIYASATGYDDLVIEDFEPGQKINFTYSDDLKPWLGDPKDLVVLRDDLFMDLCENLPVVARNRIEDQKNLWYEEFVPRQSEFFFIHFLQDGSTDETLNFASIAEKTSSVPIQIGGNATVDYGYCTIKKLV